MPRRLIPLLGAALTLCAGDAQSQPVAGGERRVNVMPSAGSNPIVNFYSCSARDRARSRANAGVLHVPSPVRTNRRRPMAGASFRSNSLSAGARSMMGNPSAAPNSGTFARGTTQATPARGFIPNTAAQLTPFSGVGFGGVTQVTPFNAGFSGGVTQFTPFNSGFSRGFNQFVPANSIIAQPLVTPYNGIVSRGAVPSNPFAVPGNVIGVPTRSFGRPAFGRIGGRRR